MADTERYEGCANRETWAFNLYWSNDQGIYEMVREHGQYLITQSASDEDDVTDYDLGGGVVSYVEETLREWSELNTMGGEDAWTGYLDAVGSRRRFDYAEIGAAVRESVTE